MRIRQWLAPSRAVNICGHVDLRLRVALDGPKGLAYPKDRLESSQLKGSGSAGEHDVNGTGQTRKRPVAVPMKRQIKILQGKYVQDNGCGLLQEQVQNWHLLAAPVAAVAYIIPEHV